MTPRLNPSHFVVHTQPNAERSVFDRLRRQDYELYFPRVKVQRRHSNRLDWVYRPFLPRYMFVRDDQRGVSDIKRTDGVSDVVRAGLEPVRVRQTELDKIKLREVDGFVQLDPVLARAFRPGQLLRVTGGQHVDRDVLFGQMRGETRALVFLNALIGRVSAEVSIRDLEVVSVGTAA